MSFLMDYVHLEEPTDEALLERNYSNGDGIELRDYSEHPLIVEELTGPRLHKDRRGRLMAIAGSLMLVFMLLSGISAMSSPKDSNTPSTPKKYTTPMATTPPGKPTVATSNSFSRPEPSQTTNQENAFLPSYSIQEVIKGPFSPQAKALKWLESYPHFRAVRQWRKRQLMALATFYYSTGGESYWSSEAKRDWMSTTLHECNWKGDVLFNPDCSSRGYKGRYQKLEMGFNTLKGTMPPELCLLTDLKYLELYGNDQLVGSIPTQFGRFAAMTDLSLYNNQLDGPLPSQLGRLTKLTVLNLDHNKLTGTIPTELGTMKSIQRLHLSDNRLTGEIPSVLKQLSTLQSLYLQGNSFNGTVSPSMCYFPNLKEIWVDCESVKCPCAECMCAETSAPIDDYLADKEAQVQVEAAKRDKVKADLDQSPHLPSTLDDNGKGEFQMPNLNKYQQRPKYPPPNNP